MASQAHYKGDKTLFNETTEGGKRKWTVQPKALGIIWGGDERYWKLPAERNGPAELLQVCWLEVSGSLELSLLPTGTYTIKFVVSLKPDAFGWSGSPVYLMAKVGGNKFMWKNANLSGKPTLMEFDIPEDLKFTVNQENKDGKLNFGLYEIWSGRWKGGLVIHRVEISPS